MQGKDQAHDQGEGESVHRDAAAGNNPYSPSGQLGRSRRCQETRQGDLPQAVKKEGFHGATTAQAQQGRKRCVTCDSPDCPSLFKCEAFKKLTPESRFEIAKHNHLCYNCLKGGLGSADCKADSTCAAKGCRITHTKSLARDSWSKSWIGVTSRFSVTSWFKASGRTWTVGCVQPQ